MFITLKKKRESTYLAIEMMLKIKLYLLKRVIEYTYSVNHIS